MFSNWDTDSTERIPHICAHCEFFDCGGAARQTAAREGQYMTGDCLNSRTGERFNPGSTDGLTCHGFFPDSTYYKGAKPA